jgi:hypothetical protein
VLDAPAIRECMANSIVVPAEIPNIVFVSFLTTRNAKKMFQVFSTELVRTVLMFLTVLIYVSTVLMFLTALLYVLLY